MKDNACRHFLQPNLVIYDQETKLQCYKTFVCSIAEYSTSVSDPVGNKQFWYQLEQVQKRAVTWTNFFYNWDSPHARLNSHYKPLQGKELQEKEAQKD